MRVPLGELPVSEQGPSRPISLAELRPDTRAQIAEIKAGSRITRRFLALGLRVGTELKSEHKRGGGLVVSSDGNRIALGKEMAARVLVERLN